MQTVERRKPIQTDKGVDKTSSERSIPKNGVSLNGNRKNNSIEPEFKYGYLLMLSMLGPLAILMAFGGKPAFISTCLGGLTAYIFDVLGAVEGTLMTMFIGVFANWATMVWAGRLLLKESLINFVLVILMGLVLLFFFIISMAYFRSMRNEFDGLFFFLETYLFTSLPLLSSTILSWFICVEFPSISLPIAFSIIYFVYVMILAKPRVSSYPIPMEFFMQKDKDHHTYVLSLSLVQTMYVIPLIISPLLYVSIKYNVIGGVDFIGLASSVLLPTLLMLFCAEQQTHYWPIQIRQNILDVMGTVKLVVGVLYIICLLNNPVFVDLNIFSNVLENEMSVLLFVGSVFLSFLLYIRKGSLRTLSSPRSSNELDALFDSNSVLGDNELNRRSGLFILSLVPATFFTCKLLNVSAILTPFAMAGTIAMIEFYQYHWHSASSFRNQMIGLLLVSFSSVMIGLIVIHFSRDTLFFLSFSFEWYNNSFSIQQFCMLCAVLAAGAIFIPAQGIISIQRQKAMSSLSATLPTAAVSSGGSDSIPFYSSAYESGHGNNGWNDSSGRFFELLFPVVVFCISCVELMLLEQDWYSHVSGMNLTSDMVYPSSFLVGTAALFSITAVRTFMSQTISAWAAWLVIITSGMKLVYLLDFNSTSIFVLYLMAVSYTFPFVAHCVRHRIKSGKSVEFINANGAVVDNGITGISPLTYLTVEYVPWLQIICYLVVGLLATLQLRNHHIIKDILILLGLHSHSFHRSVASIGFYFTFVTAIFVVFRTSHSTIRSFCVVVTVVCFMLVADICSPWIIEIDPDSPTYLIFKSDPSLATSDHSLFFLCTAALLGFSAALNILPISHPLYRLLYALAFSFCSALAILSWAFPLTLSSDSPTHSMTDFPFIYTFFSTLLGTSTALHASLPNTTSSGSWIFIITACLPFGGFIYLSGSDQLHTHYIGVVWIAAVVNTMITITTRASELLREVQVIKQSSGDRPKNKNSNHVAASVCITATFMAIFWITLGSILSPHIISDFSVPLSMLLFLSTKRGMLLQESHPIVLSILGASGWLVLSALYSILIKGSFENPLNHFQRRHALLVEEDVSFWTSKSMFHPWSNLGLLLLPLPSIILGFLRRKDEAEEVLFVLIIMCAVAPIATQLISIRLLGLIGILYGAWRFYDVGLKKKISDRLI